jgi:hypothetical protein
MHAGFQAETFNGLVHATGLIGGENLSGGEAAKGIPRYLFTVAVAAGSKVVVPTRTPDGITTVGRAPDGETIPKTAGSKMCSKDTENMAIVRSMKRPLEDGNKYMDG